jgi:hypothetical protein
MNMAPTTGAKHRDGTGTAHTVDREAARDVLRSARSADPSAVHGDGRWAPVDGAAGRGVERAGVTYAPL